MARARLAEPAEEEAAPADAAAATGSGAWGRGCCSFKFVCCSWACFAFLFVLFLFLLRVLFMPPGAGSIGVQSDGQSYPMHISITSSALYNRSWDLEAPAPAWNHPWDMPGWSR